MLFNKKTVAICVFSLVAAVFLFFCENECAFASERAVYADSSFSVGQGSGFSVRESESPLEHFADGEFAELSLSVALLLKDAKPQVCFEEMYKITPVGFAANGRKTTVSWEELLSGRYRIMLSDKLGRVALIMTTALFCFDGSAENIERINGRLRELYEKGALVTSADDADYILDLDFMRYEGFVPFIPTDGTASFSQCLVSKQSFILTDDDKRYYSEHNANTARTLSGGAINEKAEHNAEFQSAYAEILAFTRFLFLNRVSSRLGKYGAMTAVTLFLFLMIFWCGRLVRLSMQKTFSRCVAATGILIALWIIIRFIKWQTDYYYPVNRYMWYMFYVFFIFLPLLFLLMALKIGERDDDGSVPGYWRGLVAVGIVLFAFVITNDLHSLVFVVAPNGDYTYAPVYFVIAGFVSLTYIVSIIIVYEKCLHSIYKPSVIYPVTLAVVPLVYWILYIGGVNFAATSDLTLLSSIFIMTSYEAVLRTGLVPCNVRYRTLFRHSHVNLLIVDNDGEAVYASSRLHWLTEGDFAAMREGLPPRPTESDGNIVISRSDIPGGYVIRQEDFTLLNEDERKLSRSVKALTDANSVLEKRERVAAKTSSENAKKKLYDELDENIHERFEDVRSLASNLPDSLTPENENEYRLLVGAIGFTLCYIKRRCSFLFKRLRGGMLPADDIVTCVSELCEFAGDMGVRCVPSQSIDGETEPQDCEAFYDFCYSVLDYCACHDCSDLILRFFRDGEKTVMSFFGDSGLAGFSPEKDELSEKSIFEKKDLGGAVGVTLTLGERTHTEKIKANDEAENAAGTEV